MAEVLAVRATITKIVAGYSVGMVICARGRSRHLVGKTAVSLSEAEAVAEAFAAQNQIPWHTRRGALPLTLGEPEPRPEDRGTIRTDHDFLEEAATSLPNHLGILWSTIGQSSSLSWVTSACY